MTATLKDMTITQYCVCCSEPLQYVVLLDGGSPEILPPMGAIAYAAGHLCPPCGQWMRGLVAQRRARIEHAKFQPIPVVVERCSICGEPCHASESNDRNECARCAPVCAAEENGMQKCDEDHKARGVACGVCAPPSLSAERVAAMSSDLIQAVLHDTGDAPTTATERVTAVIRKHMGGGS